MPCKGTCRQQQSLFFLRQSRSTFQVLFVFCPAKLSLVDFTPELSTSNFFLCFKLSANLPASTTRSVGSCQYKRIVWIHLKMLKSLNEILRAVFLSSLKKGIPFYNCLKEVFLGNNLKLLLV